MALQSCSSLFTALLSDCFSPFSASRNKDNLIGRLHQYFFTYFETFSAPTAETLFLLVLSILAMESAHSIRFLYRHFLSGITEKSLNAFYYACTHAKVDYSRFMNVTAAMALKLVPERLKSQPVFLCIDDTMVAKFGKKFEDVSKLFDHAAHNGSNYLNGHCFVSLMLCVPVWRKQRIVYLAVPLGYRMWKKEVSKLELAASMVHNRGINCMRLLPVWFSGAFSCQAQNISICQGKIVLKNKRLAPTFLSAGYEQINFLIVKYSPLLSLTFLLFRYGILKKLHPDKAAFSLRSMRH